MTVLEIDLMVGFGTDLTDGLEVGLVAGVGSEVGRAVSVGVL